jgi:hypothetical protein
MFQTPQGDLVFWVECQHFLEAGLAMFVRFNHTTQPQPGSFVIFIEPDCLHEQVTGFDVLTGFGGCYALEN